MNHWSLNILMKNPSVITLIYQQSLSITLSRYNRAHMYNNTFSEIQDVALFFGFLPLFYRTAEDMTGKGG